MALDPGWEQGQFSVQTVSLIMYTVAAANCRGHHTSSNGSWACCVLCSRTGRRSSFSRIPGIPQHVDVLPSMGQYFLHWEKAGVAWLSHCSPSPAAHSNLLRDTCGASHTPPHHWLIQLGWEEPKVQTCHLTPCYSKHVSGWWCVLGFGVSVCYWIAACRTRCICVGSHTWVCASGCAAGWTWVRLCEWLRVAADCGHAARPESQPAHLLLVHGGQSWFRAL